MGFSDGEGGVLLEIQSELAALEQEPSLREETNFDGRAEAIDSLEFDILERIDGRQWNVPQAGVSRLRQAAVELKRQFEAIDAGIFQGIREGIRGGGCAGEAFRSLLEAYVPADSRGRLQTGMLGYDCLDTFVNGLMHPEPLPMETQPRETGMVFFQKTPARVILEVVARGCFKRGEVFYDLGSGAGQVPILANLLSGVEAKGIEVQGAFCEYARACAADLRLPGVEFIHADARVTDYAAGSAYFMYSPFEGEMLAAVLGKLGGDARKGTRIFSYGPCSVQVSSQDWLRRVWPDRDRADQLCEFERK